MFIGIVSLFYFWLPKLSHAATLNIFSGFFFTAVTPCLLFHQIKNSCLLKRKKIQCENGPAFIWTVWSVFAQTKIQVHILFYSQRICEKMTKMKLWVTDLWNNFSEQNHCNYGFESLPESVVNPATSEGNDYESELLRWSLVLSLLCTRDRLLT